MDKTNSEERKEDSWNRDCVQATAIDPLGASFPQAIAPSGLSNSLSHKVFLLRSIMSGYFIT